MNAEPKNTFIGGAALWALTGHDAEENKATAEFFRFLTSPRRSSSGTRKPVMCRSPRRPTTSRKPKGHYTETPQAEVGIQQLTLPGGEWTKGYRLGFYVQIRDVMNREYGKILTGEATVDEAFQAIEDEGNKLLERFSKTSG